MADSTKQQDNANVLCDEVTDPSLSGITTGQVQFFKEMNGANDSVLRKLFANADFDTSGAVAMVSMFGIALPSSAGPVPGGTSTAPLRVDPTGTTPQPATQSGTWNITNISGTVSLPTGAATSAKQDTIIGHVDAVEGSLTAIAANAASLDAKTVAVNTGAVVLAAGSAAFGKLVANDGVDIGDVTINNAVGNGVYIRPGTSVNLDTSAVTISTALPAGTNYIGKTRLTDGTNDITLSTANADAVSNTSTRLPVNARLEVFNGTTWDRVQSGLVGVQTSKVGFENMIPMMQYSSSFLAPANGNVLPFQCDPNGGLRVAPFDIIRVSQTPTVSTTAYVDKDLMGTKMTFANAVRVSAGTGTIRKIRIVDQSAVRIPCDLILFNADPSGTTFTDSSSFDIADADMSKIIDVINISNYSNFTDNAAVVVELDRDFDVPSGTSIYGALVARGGGTLAAATDIIVDITFRRY